MIKKCPKCGSKPVKPLPGATIFRCPKCAGAWTSWQQAEIERLQKEIERLTESAFSMAQRADHKIANLRGLLRIYGAHHFNCATRYAEVGMPSLVNHCNCGLAALIIARKLSSIEDMTIGE